MALQTLDKLFRFHSQGDTSDPAGVVTAVRVRGQVTYFDPGQGLYIQNGDIGAFVQTTQTTPLPLGTVVDVVGYPAVNRYSPKLEDAVFRIVGPPRVVAPLQLAASGIIVTKDGFSSAPHDSTVVTLRARLLEQVVGSGEDFLLMQDDGTVFTARLVTRGNTPLYARGSTLRVTGICNAILDETREARSFSLLLRSSDDIVVVSSGPWWSRAHAAWVTAALVLVILLTWAWIVIVRRRDALEEAYRREAAQRDALLALIVESTDDAILAKRLDGTILTWNRGAERVFGYAAAEVVGHAISLLIPEDLRMDEEYINGELLQGKSIDHFETVRLHKDGRRIAVSITVSPIRDADGKVIGASKVARDISARSEVAAALKLSEQRYDLVLQSLSVGVWDWDLTTGEQYWSQRMKQIAGVGADFSPQYDEKHSLIHPEDRERVMTSVRAHLNDRKPYDEEFRICDKQGKCVWVHATGQALRDETGKATRMVGSLDDISGRKWAEEKFRLVVESAPIAIVTIERSGHIVVVNRQAEKMFGYNRGEMLGKPIELLIPTPCRANHREDRECYHTSASFFDPAEWPLGVTRDLIALCKDGNEFPAEVGLTPIATEEGTLVLASIVDLTRRRELEDQSHRMNEILEEQVEERTARLKAANQELDAFAYAASHDLKAPLAVIHNASIWLEEDLEKHLTPESRENMALLRGRVRRMERLLDDLLEYSRIGRKTDNRYEEKISGDMLMENVLGLLAIPKGFYIEVHSSFSEIEIYRMPVQQILLNLISNAIKHHDKKTGLIEVSVEDLDGEFQFSVKDDGPGIPSQYHQQIFKMFQTLKPRDQVEGSGLGLSMVRKHIEGAGGHLTLESTVGCGSNFRFSWPKKAQFKAVLVGKERAS